MLLSLCLLVAGWILVWQDMPLPGIALLALFAWRSWRRFLRRQEADPQWHADDGSAAEPPWEWRSEPLPPGLFTAHPPAEERGIGGIGEIGMGGPNFWTQLLRDGAVLENICSDVLELDGGRLRVAEQRTRSGNSPLLVYDSEEHLVHLLPASETHTRLFEKAAGHPTQALAAELRQACRHSEHTQALHRVRGIWVPTTVPAPAPVLQHRLANGALLEARLMLAEDISRTPDPYEILKLAPYALFLDGVDTGRHVTHLLNVEESADGRAFCLPGARLVRGRIDDGLWHLWVDGHWHAVRGYAKRAPGAEGSHYLFDVDLAARDGGVFQATLEVMIFGLSGQETGPPAPSEIELPVSWSTRPLRLPTRDNAIEFRPPLPAAE